MVRVCGPRDKAPKGALVINTTSISKTWSKGLSPFFLGPVDLYDGNIAKNVENAWQFSKVYNCHVDDDGNPSEGYLKWAKEGWALDRAVRYPMGKGAKPAYSWWAGEKLTYIQARKRIYIPLYSQAVAKTEAFQQLLQVYKERENEVAELAAQDSEWDNSAQQLWLWDFDGYDHLKYGIVLEATADNEERKMGHAFVLARMLENLL